MAELKIAKLRTKRSVIINQQARIQEFVNSKLAIASVAEVETRLKGLERYYKSFDSVQGTLEEVDATEVDSKVRSEFEELYFQLQPAMLDMLRDIKHTDGPSMSSTLASPATASVSECNLKLPKVCLPTFSGDYTKWMNFYETFNTLIHKNSSLDNVSRFHYLRAAVSDSALKAIESIEISSENYNVALSLLKSRYDRRPVIIFEHIRELFEIPSISRASFSNLRDLTDSVNVHTRALLSLGRPVAHLDDLIVYLVLSKLDHCTLEKWNDDCPTERFPTLKQLIEFLEKRCQFLEGKDTLKQITVKSTSPSKPAPKTSRVAFTATRKSFQCHYCSRAYHFIYACKEFLKLSPQNRFNAVKRLNLCINCLKPDHQTNTCKSNGTCRNCSKPHHSLLHFETSNTVERSSDSHPFTSQTKPSTSIGQLSSCSVVDNYRKYSMVFIETALVRVLNKYGELVTCRAFLDNGSQYHFVTERLVQKLGLQPQLSYGSIGLVGNLATSSQTAVSLTFQSLFSGYKTNIEAQILTTIIPQQPASFVNIDNWPLPKGIQLADPRFYEPQDIDILIGAELYGHLLRGAKIELSKQLPVLLDTELGWVISGSVSDSVIPPRKFCNAIVTRSLPALEKIVQKFWEIESHDELVHKPSNEELLCELHFTKTFRRLESGQFVVQLPFRQDPIMHLGTSFESSKRRFFSLERKLAKNLELKDSYCNFMNEYELLGHMTKIETIPKNSFFLPHHCIQKPESSSTKLRVVFDASARTSSSKSLNDVLMIGPVVQPDLFTVLIRFRCYRYVFTADISKMYRQILIDTTDRRYQLIIWRNTPEENLQCYQLNTITYGTASASYLATRCLNQLAIEGKERFPIASDIIQNAFYVDDCMAGSNNLNTAKQSISELIDLLGTGHFELRKFCANDAYLLSDIPLSHREKFLQLQESDVVKTLGMIWQPDQDSFQFKISISRHIDCTKRTILSDLGRIFDPLGLIGPVVVLGKIFLQQLWKGPRGDGHKKFDWDEDLPIEYKTSWTTYVNQLEDLNLLKIPRHLFANGPALSTELHAFCDASLLAYGSCCYLRTVNENKVAMSSLICSKSRVAPLKATTIARLELLGALLMTELVHRLLKIVPFEFDNIWFYTDSEVVLAWLASPSYSYSTFVSNRIAKIQELTRIDQWRHVRGKCNPADLISRGLKPKQLATSEIWFSGPPFLRSTEEMTWLAVSEYATCAETPEKRNLKLVLATVKGPDEFFSTINHRNSISRLERIIAHCYRFVNNCQLRKDERKLRRFGKLSTIELEAALTGIIRHVQHHAFREEHLQLRANKLVNYSSRLKSLAPFIDENGLIRVGGRLRNSNLPLNAKYPVVLPKAHTFTDLLMMFFHFKYMHAAPQTLLSIVRQKYWPIDGKTAAKRVVNRCIRCFRTKPRGIQQYMGDLPSERVKPESAFVTTGIDFCGPLKISLRVRGKTPIKAYIAIFVCFTTKAVHMEVVGNLSSESFIAALRRFIARRGVCRTIFCDNATNFVGAKRELQELADLFQSQTHLSKLQAECQPIRIEWKPIPPRSPHFGGLWEAAVKIAKYHLLREIGNIALSYEEMSTVVAQIEAIMNSRPLTPLSSDPNDMQPLTPGHFLVGQALTTIPDPDYTEVPCNRLSRFRHIQQLQQIFWRRWSVEYLHLLQQRRKWISKDNVMKVGTLVIIHEDNLPPMRWLLGRILQMFPGKDGVARVAEVKTQNGTYRRTVNKLFALPIEDAA